MTPRKKYISKKKYLTRMIPMLIVLTAAISFVKDGFTFPLGSIVALLVVWIIGIPIFIWAIGRMKIFKDEQPEQ